MSSNFFARSRRRLWLVVATLGVLFVVLGRIYFGLAQSGPGNILKNPGFEEPGGPGPAGWTFESKVAGKGALSMVEANRHGGRFSLRLAPNSRNTPPWDLTHDPFGVGQGFPGGQFRGKKLYLSGWLSAEGGATARLGAYAVMRNGGVISAEVRQSSAAGGPVLHDDMLVLPDKPDALYVVVLCVAEGTSGAAYFDDLYVGTSPPSEAPAATAPQESGSAMTARVTVRADRQIRRIPRTIYGTNLEWMWDGNGIWDAKNGRLQPEILTLTRDLDVPLFRFPGGILADFYHWRDGTGPRERRKETEHSPGGARSVHAFGTDEALSFASQAGGRLMITVNIVTGTPEEAAEWVRYVNQRNSRDRVEYWELGNESYLRDNSPHSRPATMPPDRYARKFLEFARAMRAVDPSIKLGAIDDTPYGSVAPRAYPNWTETVLRIAGAEIDFLSVHNGYAPALYADKGWDVRTVYAAMLAAPIPMRESLQDLARRIESAVPSRARSVKIAITEWGPYFQVEPSGRFLDHVKTLGSALFVASALKVYVETPQVEIANAFKLVDSLWMGWIGPRRGTYLPKAPYFALQMYTRHFGDVLVESSASGPTYTNRRAVGWVDALTAVPYLDVVAGRSEDGRTLYVMGINKHFDQELTARISLQGFRPASEGVAWTLEGTGIDANTGTELFKAPGVTWAKQAAAEPNPRFAQGAPGEVKISRKPLKALGSEFEFRFPPHSVTSLEIRSSGR